MLNKKKILSLIVSAALAASALTLTGCTRAVSTAMTINGNDIPAGLYILYSGFAYNDAVAQLQEEQPDLDTTAEDFDYYAQTVSDMSFGDYVKQEALNYCKRHAAINSLYDRLGIVSNDEEREELTENVNVQWDFDLSGWSSMQSFSYLDDSDTMGEYYESIGVSKSSFRQYMTDVQRSSQIFTRYYGEGGIEEVSKDEIKSQIDENYAMVRYFSISLRDSDDNLIEDEAQLAALEELGNGYADKLNSGASYAEVYQEYQDYLEAANADEETDGTDTADDADADGETELPADSTYDRVIQKTSTSPSEDFVKALFEQEKNSAVLFKADTYYYVVQKLDILSTEGADGEDETDYVAQYTDTTLQDMKGESLEDVYRNEYAGYSVSENTIAPDYCREQALNAMQGLSTINNIQYQYFYSQLFSGQ